MGVLVFVYMQVEPFLMFALRRRIIDDEVSAYAEERIGNTADSIINHTLAFSDTDNTASAILSDDPLSALTKKEREVAELICLGYTNADIAKVLYISEQTVKTHTKKIYPKLGVHSRLELATLVSRNQAEH